MANQIEACKPCIFSSDINQALVDYAAQPTLTVAVKVEGEHRDTIYHVARDIDPAKRLTMIHDPQPLVDEVNAQLAQNKCDFTKTGKCAVAAMIINQAVRRPINE